MIRLLYRPPLPPLKRLSHYCSSQLLRTSSGSATHEDSPPLLENALLDLFQDAAEGNVQPPETRNFEPPLALCCRHIHFESDEIVTYFRDLGEDYPHLSDPNSVGLRRDTDRSSIGGWSFAHRRTSEPNYVSGLFHTRNDFNDGSETHQYRLPQHVAACTGRAVALEFVAFEKWESLLGEGEGVATEAREAILELICGVLGEDIIEEESSCENVGFFSTERNADYPSDVLSRALTTAAASSNDGDYAPGDGSVSVSLWAFDGSSGDLSCLQVGDRTGVLVLRWFPPMSCFMPWHWSGAVEYGSQQFVDSVLRYGGSYLENAREYLEELSFVDGQVIGGIRDVQEDEEAKKYQFVNQSEHSSLVPGDLIITSSAGLFDNVTSEMICEFALDALLRYAQVDLDPEGVQLEDLPSILSPELVEEALSSELYLADFTTSMAVRTMVMMVSEELFSPLTFRETYEMLVEEEREKSMSSSDREGRGFSNQVDFSSST